MRAQARAMVRKAAGRAGLRMRKEKKLPENQQVMLKLTIPEVDNLYADFVKHPRVLKVVALSGGYSRDEANKRLAKQNGMIASFSRALSEGLSAQQSDADFNKSLDTAIESIYQASKT
jgi:fructose-bisphosphate aldolase class I